jgi:hypothetical protein
VILGHKIPAGGGVQDGERVIDILVRHPSTAKFISTKLVRKFVSDDPPQPLVDRVAAVFTKTGGDIKEMLKTIFTSPEFFSQEAHRSKIKSPFELTASAIRALGGDTNGSPRLGQFIGRMGQPLYQCQPPTGYADRADHWVNTGALLERLNFSLALGSNKIPGTTVDLKKVTAGVDVTNEDRVLDRAITILLGGNISSQTRTVLQKQLKEGVPVSGELTLDQNSGEDSDAGEMMRPRAGQNRGLRGMRGWDDQLNGQPAPAQVDPQAAKIFGLVLGSPEFQRR